MCSREIRLVVSDSPESNGRSPAYTPSTSSWPSGSRRTRFTWESYEFAEMATGLVVIPIWIPQATFVIGCWLLLAAVVDEFITVLRGGKPSFQVALEERHAQGDYSSDV